MFVNVASVPYICDKGAITTFNSCKMAVFSASIIKKSKHGRDFGTTSMVSVGADPILTLVDTESHEYLGITSKTQGDDSSAAILFILDNKYDNDSVVACELEETYAEVLTAAGSTASTFVTEASKDASGGYAGLTLFKINFKNALNTFTSFFTNANTAARTYTFPDKDGTVAMTNDFGKTSAILSAGTRTIANPLIGLTSSVMVQKVSLGGTVAAGGYKVTLNAGVGYTITALQADGTTTETANTDTVQVIIVY